MNPVRWPSVAVKYAASGFSSASMDEIVAPSLPAFAAAFPDSTVMLTFNKNRIAHLLLIKVSTTIRVSYRIWKPLHGHLLEIPFHPLLQKAKGKVVCWQKTGTTDKKILSCSPAVKGI